jgi:hypothetical protein
LPDCRVAVAPAVAVSFSIESFSQQAVFVTQKLPLTMTIFTSKRKPFCHSVLKTQMAGYLICRN